ncbi:MAG: alpha/beta hydrolase, partial [Pirellulaceae bacterium]|nr:alpha/beta hydrolase [Pirellulaceae bacterium]
MGRWWILTSLGFVSCGIAVVWLAVELAQSADAGRKRETRIAALDAELAAARQLAAEQREMLRTQTLRSTVRAPDEFFSLLPAKFPQGNWQLADTRFEDCWFRSADGLRLHGWLLPHPRARCEILIVHGNAGNLTHRAPLAAWLHDHCAASVLLFDYRGYGRSEGTPTIPGLLDDARAARR